jgi:hypothetical protein
MGKVAAVFVGMIIGAAGGAAGGFYLFDNAAELQAVQRKAAFTETAHAGCDGRLAELESRRAAERDEGRREVARLTGELAAANGKLARADETVKTHLADAQLLAKAAQDAERLRIAEGELVKAQKVFLLDAARLAAAGWMPAEKVGREARELEAAIGRYLSVAAGASRRRTVQAMRAKAQDCPLPELKKTDRLGLQKQLAEFARTTAKLFGSVEVKKVSVSAKDGWKIPGGIAVLKGDVLLMRAAPGGAWHLGPVSRDVPVVRGVPESKQGEVSTLPWGAVVCRIRGSKFATVADTVGREDVFKTCRAAAAGTLEFICNDNYRENNDGACTVEVMVLPAADVDPWLKAREAVPD